MKGKYHIVIQNKRLRYELNIRRNITIIRGDSATGKTTLINLLEQAVSLGESSGVEVLCERPCRTLGGNDWNIVLPNIHEHIIFLDEEKKFVKSQEFAAAVKDSDNYFVIITREDLPNLPYSVEEIYGIHISGKYHDLKRTYNELYHIYSTEEMTGKQEPKTVVVEDSNSGFEFFYGICSEKGIDCISAGGKSNLKNVMNRLGKVVQDILNKPEEFIESQKYFSWERFFTVLLMECTQDSYLHYSKSKLNKAYLQEKMKQAIIGVMEGVVW